MAEGTNRMPGKRFHVTDAELSVLQVLWEREAATTREICGQLYPAGGTAQYYTVQKLLERLESRGCVRRDRTERVHVFSAAIARDALIEERLRDLSESLCGGDVLPMLSGLMRMRRWTAAEQKQLQDLLSNIRGGKRPPKSK
jgi:predicted transcriptional regulator